MARSGQFRVNLPGEVGLREVAISEEVFRRVATLVTQKEADTLYANGATWIATGPGGVILDTLINKRNSMIVAGRFPDGFYKADLTDCLKEIAAPGYYKTMQRPISVDAASSYYAKAINKLEAEIKAQKDIITDLLARVQEHPSKEDVKAALTSMVITLREALETADPEEVEFLQTQLDNVNKIIADEITEIADEANDTKAEPVEEVPVDDMPIDDEPVEEVIEFPEEGVEIGDEFVDETTGEVYVYEANPVEGEIGIWVPKAVGGTELDAKASE